MQRSVVLCLQKICAHHVVGHFLNKAQLGMADGQRRFVFTQDLQIEEAVGANLAQSRHDLLPVNAGTGAVGHLMHIVLAVIFGDVHGTQVLTCPEDKFPMALLGLATTVGQVQVAGIQADAQIVVTQGIDDAQQLLHRMGLRHGAEIFQADSHAKLLGIVTEQIDPLQSACHSLLRRKLLAAIKVQHRIFNAQRSKQLQLTLVIFQGCRITQALAKTQMSLGDGKILFIQKAL